MKSDRDELLARIRRRWRIGGTLWLLATAVAWWLLWVRPLLAARAEVRDQRAEMEGLRNQESAIQAKLVEATNEQQHWLREQSRHRSRASKAHDEAGFLQWVNQQAQANGLLLRDFRPAGRATQGNYEGRGVMVSSQGPYQGICRFLQQLRTCPRMNRVTTLEISPRDPTGEEYAFTIQVLLFTQSQSPPAAGKGG